MTMQQNKTNHAGSQLGLPVNQSNCRFIGSDGPGFFSRAGNSFAFYLLVFLASGFLPWFLPPLRSGFIPWPADPGTENRGDRAGKRGAAHQAGVLLLTLGVTSTHMQCWSFAAHLQLEMLPGVTTSHQGSSWVLLL